MTALPKARQPRTAVREKRRSELIAATMKCIARKGIGGTTLADVASQAGLSQGIVNLHFESKENLFRDTLRHVADEYRSRFESALEHATDSPAAALRALLEIDLSPSICNPAKLAVWFAFWGEVKARPTYRAICNEVDKYYDSVVESLCRDIVREGGYACGATEVATALASMTNGLWLACLLDPQDWNRHQAMESINSYLEAVFPRHFGHGGQGK